MILRAFLDSAPDGDLQPVIYASRTRHNQMLRSSRFTAYCSDAVAHRESHLSVSSMLRVSFMPLVSELIRNGWICEQIALHSVYCVRSSRRFNTRKIARQIARIRPLPRDFSRTIYETSVSKRLFSLSFRKSAAELHSNLLVYVWRARANELLVEQSTACHTNSCRPTHV